MCVGKQVALARALARDPSGQEAAVAKAMQQLQMAIQRRSDRRQKQASQQIKDHHDQNLRYAELDATERGIEHSLQLNAEVQDGYLSFAELAAFRNYSPPPAAPAGAPAGGGGAEEARRRG